MTTFKLNIVKIFVLVFSLLLLSLSSCAGKEQSNTNTNEVVSTLKKPKMDIHAAVISNNIEVVQQHIAAGSDLNAVEPMSKSTPLMIASTFNRVEIAKALINAQADLTLKNNDGSTALHTAAFFGRIEIVQLLIAAKIDKSVKNNFGVTARESVMAEFSEMKPVYEMFMAQLQPMGFSLDLEELEKARPTIALMLQ